MTLCWTCLPITAHTEFFLAQLVWLSACGSGVFSASSQAAAKLGDELRPYRVAEFIFPLMRYQRRYNGAAGLSIQPAWCFGRLPLVLNLPASIQAPCCLLVWRCPLRTGSSAGRAIYEGLRLQLITQLDSRGITQLDS